MYAYLADTLHFQPSRQARAVTVFAWIKARIAARRSHIAERQETAYLRTLDRNMLAEMGVDATELGTAPPKLVSHNPHVVAINIFATSARH